MLRWPPPRARPPRRSPRVGSMSDGTDKPSERPRERAARKSAVPRKAAATESQPRGPTRRVCRECGKRVSVGGAFCSNCGTAFNVQESRPTARSAPLSAPTLEYATSLARTPTPASNPQPAVQEAVARPGQRQRSALVDLSGEPFGRRRFWAKLEPLVQQLLQAGEGVAGWGIGQHQPRIRWFLLFGYFYNLRIRTYAIVVTDKRVLLLRLRRRPTVERLALRSKVVLIAERNKRLSRVIELQFIEAPMSRYRLNIPLRRHFEVVAPLLAATRVGQATRE